MGCRSSKHPPRSPNCKKTSIASNSADQILKLLQMMGVSSATEDPIFFLGDEFQSSFSSGSYTSYPDFASYDGAEVMKTFSSSSVETSGADVSSPSILSFSNLPPVKPKEEVGFSVTRGSKRSSDSPVTQEAKKVNLGTRPPAQAQDHIIAERKRREKLSQKFIALSAIIPGLKKVPENRPDLPFSPSSLTGTVIM